MQKSIYKIFENIRSGTMGESETHKFLKEYSNDYNYEVLQLLLKDLEFYFFMVKEEKLSEFSWEEKEKVINEFEEKNIELPVFPRLIDILPEHLKEKERLKNTGWDLDRALNVDWEKVLFPHEFFLLYQFQRQLRNKIEEVKKSTTNKTFEILEHDFSDNSDKVKLIMLEKLGIIDYIKTIQIKPDTISHTSEILSAITGIKSQTLNSYLYPMLRPYRDDNDKNSPFNNPENLAIAQRELIKLKIKNLDADG